MDQKELFHGAKQFLKSNKVKAYFEKQQTEKIEALKKEHEELIKYVSESIDRCKPETRSKLRPMLKVEFVASLLQSIVAECKHKGVDPTERLSSPELMDQITQVQEIQNSEDSVRAMDKLGKRYTDAIDALNIGGCPVDSTSIETFLQMGKRTHADGNNLFFKKEFKAAYTCYQFGEKALQGIKPIASCKHELSGGILKIRVLLLGNMALAALRMKEYSSCVDACDQGLKLGGALLIEGMENKLLFRRAKARCMQTRLKKRTSKSAAHQQAREHAMDDCRQILTSKNVTPAHREATLKLMSKYNLGKPPVFSQVKVASAPMASSTAAGKKHELLIPSPLVPEIAQATKVSSTRHAYARAPQTHVLVD